MSTTTDEGGVPMNTRIPAETFPPGEYLSDELDARGWSQAEFADIIGRPASAVSQIVKGKRAITPEIAKELAAALGTGAELWLNLEAAYRLTNTEAAPKRISRRARLRERCPVREMSIRGWITASKNTDVLESDVLKFLGVPELSQRPKLAYAAKQTSYDAETTTTQEAWLLRVKQLAQTLTVAPYSNHKLEAALDRLGELLRSPDDAHQVPRILAEAGVRFVVVEKLPGLRVDGVCFWPEPKKPVIGMSLKEDRIDNFWFVLRHEIEHVLNGDGKDAVMIDSDVDRAGDDVSEQERKANRAAAEFCVPQALLDDFVARKGPLFTDDNIRRFAHSIDRHSGLVAGQLRKRFDQWNRYVRHLAKIRHVVASTALVDGFGSTPEIGLR